jgi:uncharacterized repeat protein (TIGR01451 family)
MKHLRLPTTAAFLLTALATTVSSSSLPARLEEPAVNSSVRSSSFSSSRAPDHDTYVKATAPNTNYDGNNLATSASTAGCTPTDITYLQWNLADIADIETVLTATLTLTATYAAGTSSAQLSLYETGDNWTETTINYSNAPPVGALIETIAAPPPGNPPSPAIITLSSAALATYINNQAHGDGVASLALRFNGGCSGTFTLAVFRDTESGANGPGLVLETAIYAPDLAIHKEGPDSARPGETITYTLAYSNTGNVIAQQVVISDPLPAAITGSTAVYTYTGATVTSREGSPFAWDVADLAAGEGGIITITAAISPTFFSDSFSNTATIATATVESNLDNNAASAVIAVGVSRCYLPIVLYVGFH